MIVFAFVDHFFDVIGVATCLYWCVKGTKKFARWKSGAQN